MKILAVDIGTGTQDILLFDSHGNLENSLKMIQPSPTMIAYHRIRNATQQGHSILLTGVTMGGGPSHWAAEAHLNAGLSVYATPKAARSFNDDLEVIESTGIQIVSADEADSLPDDIVRIWLKDFDFEMICGAFSKFDVPLTDIDLIAAAVFDHGAAPPGYSDRQFRFDFIEKRVTEKPYLTSFAFLQEQIPSIMTRMRAVAASAEGAGLPLLVMDTAPAAVLGAMQDPVVAAAKRFLMTNVGNFHTIGFHMLEDEILGVFEHHTGMLDTLKLDELLSRLEKGTLTHEEVFSDNGHGAFTFGGTDFGRGSTSFGVAVTGPRWKMMRPSRLNPHFATPHGDMMMAGCYGLVKAAGELIPNFQEEIDLTLNQGREKPPWELT